MNATKKYWLVLSALLLGSCSCGTMSPLSFLITHNQTVKIGKNKFVFYDIPDGYNKDTIHVNNAGSDYEIIIPYKDSAFLYYHRGQTFKAIFDLAYRLAESHNNPIMNEIIEIFYSSIYNYKCF